MTPAHEGLEGYRYATEPHVSEPFRTIADIAPVMIWLTDAKGRCIDVNRAVLEFKGRQREQELGDGWLFGIHPDDRLALEETFEKAIAGHAGYEIEYRLRDAAGSYRWVSDHAVPRRAADGTFLGLVGVTTDITDRKEAIAREWRACFDAVDSMMIVTSRDGRIENLNRAAQLELGALAKGRRLAAVANAEPWQTVAQLIDETHAQTESQTGESRDGSGRSWAVEVSPLADGSHFVVLIRDVSAVVALQEQVARHERLSAMGQLVAGVAHEVRNPLFALSAGIDALEAELPQELGEFAAVFRREIDRMSRFMQDLLDFGRPVEAAREELDLEPLVASAIELCRPLLVERSLTCTLTAETNLPRLVLDGARCETMVRNLVDNAARYSPVGSSIAIGLAFHRDPVLGAQIELTVRDRGPGFPAKDLTRLAQPFFSRRRGGTGLGLAIVARIVADHGGSLAFENTNPGGLVRVRLRVQR